MSLTLIHGGRNYIDAAARAAKHLDKPGQVATAQMSVPGPACVETRVLGKQARHGEAISGSGTDRLHQTTNAQNADYPFHIVGQDV
jgi:hypothetical protein